jgi:indole-3-glycerol phosphate synthase
VDAVLIGEALMKSADKKAMLAYFKGEKEKPYVGGS